MAVPSLNSPNVGNLQVGKGNVYFKKEGTTFFRHLGNVTELVITPDMTTLEHFTSMAGTKSKDLTIILEKKAQVKLTMEERTAENIALMLLGDTDMDAVGGPEVEIFSANAVNGYLRFVGTNDVGPKETVDLYYVSFLPGGDYGVISDEWNNMEAVADVLLAPTGDPNVGKFGKVKITNVNPAVAPTIVAPLVPATGPAAGGTAILINGTNFSTATSLTIGGVALVDAIVVSNTQISGKTPVHAAGVVDVIIITGGGTDTEVGGFTYT